MKYYVFFFALLLSGMCHAASSQEALINEATSGNVQAILSLGSESSPEVINSLQKIYHEGGHKAIYAEMALAKLGDKPAFEKICSDLSSKATPVEQNRAIGKLQYIANPEAIAVLVSLLEKAKNVNHFEAKGRTVNLDLISYCFYLLATLLPCRLVKLWRIHS